MECITASAMLPTDTVGVSSADGNAEKASNEPIRMVSVRFRGNRGSYSRTKKLTAAVAESFMERLSPLNDIVLNGFYHLLSEEERIRWDRITAEREAALAAIKSAAKETKPKSSASKKKSSAASLPPESTIGPPPQSAYSAKLWPWLESEGYFAQPDPLTGDLSALELFDISGKKWCPPLEDLPDDDASSQSLNLIPSTNEANASALRYRLTVLKDSFLDPSTLAKLSESISLEKIIARGTMTPEERIVLNQVIVDIRRSRVEAVDNWAEKVVTQELEKDSRSKKRRKVVK